VPRRNRLSVTALNLGIYGIPAGPTGNTLRPFGALFLWRNWDEGRTRFRGEIVGLYDNIRYNTTPSFLGGAELVMTVYNMTIPVARSEYIDGVRISAEELEWHEARAGVGLGFRKMLAPGHQDNALEAALTYEPGLLLFHRGDDAAPAFVEPTNTYEGRVHMRIRADALERNLMEMPHQGVAAGLDAQYGHRAHWENWGGPVTGPQSGSAGRDWMSVSAYAVAAGGVPGVPSDRHRLIASLYGGTGDDLDRFSSHRLGGGPSGREWESLARPLLYGAAFEEVYTHNYALLNLEYRYELLFFIYLHLRGQLAWVDIPHGATVVNQTEAEDSVSMGVTSGFISNSDVELGYTHSFDLFRQRDGTYRRGGEAILMSWSKEF
jgi:hypothetical protein